MKPVNIVSPQFKANPFPFLADLRTSQPVYRTVLPDKTPVWLITRYEDVATLLKDERFAKNRRAAMTSEQLRKMPWVPPMFRPLERNMLDLDVPDHTRLRALVHKAFTPSLIGQMRDRIQTFLADELIGRVAWKGEIDLINDYALPLPMTIITEILGVPNSDHHKFHRWSKAVVSLSSPNATLRVIPSVWMFIRYLRRFFDRRRLSFGQGIHFCLGAPLARLEAQIAVITLLCRLPDLNLSVASDSLCWRPSMILRGLEALPASFGGRFLIGC